MNQGDMLKEKISKILEDFNNDDKHIYEDRLEIHSSSLTTLIIKWLESKRKKGIKFLSGRQNSELSAYSPTDNQKVGRNQLITELIGEMR